MIQQYATSLQFHRWKVDTAVVGQVQDPTSDVVEFALTTEVDAHGDPVAPTDGFVAGSWDNPSPNVYLAKVLIGPDGVLTPTAGTYYVWMRVTAPPEIPVRLVDTLKVA